MNAPQWLKDAASNVAAGVGAAGRGIASLAASTWAGMSPAARATVRDLAIGFALGALAVGMLVR